MQRQVDDFAVETTDQDIVKRSTEGMGQTMKFGHEEDLTTKILGLVDDMTDKKFNRLLTQILGRQQCFS